MTAITRVACAGARRRWGTRTSHPADQTTHVVPTRTSRRYTSNKQPATELGTSTLDLTMGNPGKAVTEG